MNIERKDVYVTALVLGAYATAGNMPQPASPCCDTHVEVREDGSTPVEDLEICERQKVTAVVYRDGQEPVFTKIVWDSDAPTFSKGDEEVHVLMNGW